MWILFLAIILVGAVSAVELDEGCSYKGFDHTISSLVYNGSWVTVSGDVNVSGSARKINWTSEIYIDGVVYKSNGRTYTLDGGFNGTVPKTVLSNDFEWVAFCSASSIPEFTLFGIIIVLGAGILVYRKVSK